MSRLSACRLAVFVRASEMVFGMYDKRSCCLLGNRVFLSCGKAILLLLVVIATPQSATPCVAAPGSRTGLCPDFQPQPTPISKPATIQIASPNFSARDFSPGVIDSVVMHTTETSLSGTIDIFEDRFSLVSSHFVIAANGDIYEMVDSSDRAWHATYYNSRSIGIEMVGYARVPSTWNEDNLDALVDLLAWIVTAYPEIPLVRPEGIAYDFPNDRFDAPGIVAHSQVQPWNKTDPGIYFPWDAVLEDVAARIAAVPEPSSLAMLLGGLGGLTVISRWRGCRR